MITLKWLSLWITIIEGKDSFGWNYFNFYYWKIDFLLPMIFQQPHMVGWVSHQPHNQDQYQTFLSIDYRLGENSLKKLVLTETKIMFLKIMDRFGFWYQPLVLGYVWPKHLYPFPHWSYQLVVHRIHNPKKKKIVLTETIFSFFKNVPFPRGPIINLYYYVMVTPGPTTHTTINHLGGSGLSTPFQTCWDTLYVRNKMIDLAKK